MGGCCIYEGGGVDKYNFKGGVGGSCGKSCDDLCSLRGLGDAGVPKATAGGGGPVGSASRQNLRISVA